MTNSPKFLIFCSIFFCRIAEQLSLIAIVASFSNLHLFVSSSFRNFAYLGIWDNVLTSGRLMWSCLNTSKNFLNQASSLSFFYLAKYRTMSWYSHTCGGWGCWASFPLLLLFSFTTSSPEVVSLATYLLFLNTRPLSIRTSTSLPLLKVIALSCSLGLTSVLFQRPCCGLLELASANCLTWLFRLWMEIWTFLIVACTTSNFASVLTMNLGNTSLVEYFLSLCGLG